MKEIIRDEISINSEENLEYLKTLLSGNADVIFRDFKIGNWKAALIYIDGMSDKTILSDYVMESLMFGSSQVDNTKEIKDRILTFTDVKEIDKLSAAVKSILSGDTVMFIDELEVCLVFGNRIFAARPVSEPSSETVLRGGRDGFTETVRFNTALIRRRIRDTRLKMEYQAFGTRSKTDTYITYIDDIVNKDVLEEFKKRLANIDIDAIMDSGYIEQLVEDNQWSIFPQMQSTERPDVVAAALYEGRVAMIVDNTPFVIIIPATLPSLFQSPDDYNQRWISSSLVRFMRVFSLVLSLILPALYVAVSSYQTAIIPSRLAYSIAESREGLPFPAYIEAIIMEISLAILMEAIVRLPRPIASTIGIVGGLIIGQAAVSAGIVSPVMIVVTSVTAISSFIIPNYEVTTAFRIVRFLLIIASAIVGLYGIMIGLIILIIHLNRLTSFGIPYMSPIVNNEVNDFKDTFWRAPIKYLKERPRFMKTGDKIRQK